MSFPYKHCLAIGATSGIGRALASRLIEAGMKVTVVGRRQERLDEFVNSHGHDKASGVAFDIGRLEDIPKFAAEYVCSFRKNKKDKKMKRADLEHHSVIAKSPDIDCLFLNAGIQNPYDLASAQPFDLASFHEEVKVNFSSFVSLVHAFLPYFKKNPHPSSFILYVRSSCCL